MGMNRLSGKDIIAATSMKWLIDESFVDQMAAKLDSLSADELAGIMSASYSDSDYGQDKPYKICEGIADINVKGVLSKNASWYSWLFDGATVSGITKKLDFALCDADVKCVRMVFDTPGGNVDGICDLGDFIWEGQKIKPIYGYVSDNCCSAGYWLASQTKHLMSNATSRNGNIGVYVILHDTSKMYEDMGIKPIVVKSVEYKALGVSGVPISKTAIAEFQTQVDATHALFEDAVKRGRSMSDAKVKDVANGRVYIGQAAQDVDLIDAVGSLHDSTDYITKQLQKKSYGSYSMTDIVKNQTQASEEKGFMDHVRKFFSGDGPAAPTPPQPQPLLVYGSAPITPQLAVTSQSTAPNPIVVVAEELGIKSVDDMKKMAALADIGKQYRTELVAEAKAQAVRRYGEDPAKAARISATMDNPGLAIEDIKSSRDGWADEADAKYGISKTAGTQRISAPPQLPDDNNPTGATSEDTGSSTRDLNELLSMTNLGRKAIAGAKK